MMMTIIIHGSYVFEIHTRSFKWYNRVTDVGKCTTYTHNAIKQRNIFTRSLCYIVNGYDTLKYWVLLMYKSYYTFYMYSYISNPSGFFHFDGR